MQKRIYSLLVDNTAGVLSRVAGMFSRRGYNIDSLTVGETADSRFSRMTVCCSGDDRILEQIEKQLAKLVDVRDIKVLKPGESVVHEVVMIKVKVKPEQRQGVLSIADIFRAKIVDVSMDSLIVEMTGSQSKLSAFIDLLRDYEILELARTGMTGLSRGSEDVRFLQ
ncbi:MAG: acetolactate synthase small subunit [Blautia sp.]|nr:acetolactate synthase small subunit [Blautia sp.]MDY5032479.1 acetolactate synthase small subunit [Blautia sp.]